MARRQPQPAVSSAAAPRKQELQHRRRLQRPGRSSNRATAFFSWNHGDDGDRVHVRRSCSRFSGQLDAHVVEFPAAHSAH